MTNPGKSLRWSHGDIDPVVDTISPRSPKWKRYFPLGMMKGLGGMMGPPPSAMRDTGVTVNANNTAATHNKRVFFTVISFELELLRDNLPMCMCMHICAQLF